MESGMEITQLCALPRDDWQMVSSKYAFSEFPQICKDKGCPNAVRHSLKCVHSFDIEVQPHTETINLHTSYSQSHVIGYAGWKKIAEAVEFNFRPDEHGIHMFRDRIILLSFHGFHDEFTQLYIWIDLPLRAVIGVYSYKSDDVIDFVDAEITRDSTTLAALCIYAKPSKSSRYRPMDRCGQYFINIYDNHTATISKCFSLPTSSQPSCMTFDPRYSDNSRLIVFSSSSQTIANVCLNTQKCLKCINIVGIAFEEIDTSHWCRVTKDGRFVILIVQAIDLGIVKTKTIILKTDGLVVLTTLTADIDVSNIPCTIEYIPGISRCQTRFCLLTYSDDIELEEATGCPPIAKQELQMKVFQLPMELELKKLCRTVILRQMNSENDIRFLPLPSRMKSFLEFTTDF